jgi:hypothetical protein
LFIRVFADLIVSTWINRRKQTLLEVGRWPYTPPLTFPAVLSAVYLLMQSSITVGMLDNGWLVFDWSRVENAEFENSETALKTRTTSPFFEV